MACLNRSTCLKKLQPEDKILLKIGCGGRKGEMRKMQRIHYSFAKTFTGYNKSFIADGERLVGFLMYLQKLTQISSTAWTAVLKATHRPLKLALYHSANILMPLYKANKTPIKLVFCQ